MTTREMIEKLKHGETIDSMLVADRLEELMGYIDDMHNGHYVDALDWFCEQYLELVDKLRRVGEIIAAD